MKKYSQRYIRLLWYGMRERSDSTYDQRFSRRRPRPTRRQYRTAPHRSSTFRPSNFYKSCRRQLQIGKGRSRLRAAKEARERREIEKGNGLCRWGDQWAFCHGIRSVRDSYFCVEWPYLTIYLQMDSFASGHLQNFPLVQKTRSP